MKIIEQIDKFRDDRDWRQFHNEKDLAISVSLEAAELLELFQWNSAEYAIEHYRDKIEEELADVLMYAFMMASNLNMDIEQIIQKKIEKNALKYPISESKGKAKTH